MATLADLKLYVADMASDMADGKADRMILRHINNAIRNLASMHAWSRYRLRAHVPLEQAEAGSYMAVTADSDQITLASAQTEVFKTKYLTEKWNLTVTGDSNLIFRLGEITDPRTARLATGQKWIGSTDSETAYVFSKSTYPLPTGCTSVIQARLSADRTYLEHRPTPAFDDYKNENPTLTGGPIAFTVRENELEVWPPLGASTTRQSLVLTYEKQPQVYKSTDPDTTAIDWEARWDDALFLALDVEIATRHAGQTQLDPAVSTGRLMQRVQHYKALDEGLVRQARQFGLGGSASRSVLERTLFRRGSTGADQ